MLCCVVLSCIVLFLCCILFLCCTLLGLLGYYLVYHIAYSLLCGGAAQEELILDPPDVTSGWVDPPTECKGKGKDRKDGLGRGEERHKAGGEGRYLEPAAELKLEPQ